MMTVMITKILIIMTMMMIVTMMKLMMIARKKMIRTMTMMTTSTMMKDLWTLTKNLRIYHKRSDDDDLQISRAI